MSVAPRHEWPRPPEGGYTADDLDRLPDLPAHTELIDGSLVFVSPRTSFHMRTNRLLEHGLLRTVPDELDVSREMSIVLGTRQRPEPDLLVVPAEADTGPRQISYQAADVILAVEVVSPDSEDRDRDTKPRKYASAGIPHFWLVEDHDGRPVVYVYELDPVNRGYVLSGIHHERLKLSDPFDIDIDLTRTRRL